MLQRSVAGHAILEATYRRDERFALLQLVGLVRAVRQRMIFGIHAIYDAGEDHGPPFDHGLIAANR